MEDLFSPIYCASKYSWINIHRPDKIKYPCKLDNKQQATKVFALEYVPGKVILFLDPKRQFTMT